MALQVFTLSDQCALHSFKVDHAIKRCKFTNAGAFLCEQPVYANNRYAINRTIFFTCEWVWFGILQSYAIKRFMRLTGMQLADFV